MKPPVTHLQGSHTKHDTMARSANSSNTTSPMMAGKRWTHPRTGFLAKAARRAQRAKRRASHPQKQKRDKNQKSGYRKELVTVSWVEFKNDQGKGWLNPVTQKAVWFNQQPEGHSYYVWKSTAEMANLPKATLPECYKNRYAEE